MSTQIRLAVSLLAFVVLAHPATAQPGKIRRPPPRPKPLIEIDPEAICRSAASSLKLPLDDFLEDMAVHLDATLSPEAKDFLENASEEEFMGALDRWAEKMGFTITPVDLACLIPVSSRAESGSPETPDVEP
jgi:hypothetical protein